MAALRARVRIRQCSVEPNERTEYQFDKSPDCHAY